MNPIDRKKHIINSKRKALSDEANHYARIRGVFSTDEGRMVAEWILSDLCDFWAASLDDSNIWRYNVGRAFFNAIAVADMGIAHGILDHRRSLAEETRNEERKRLEQDEKELK